MLILIVHCQVVKEDNFSFRSILTLLGVIASGDKAMEATRQTKGVERVIDELSIAQKK